MSTYNHLRNDISSPEDIQLLVDEFYTKIREDQLLGPIFNKVIENRWPEHLQKMYGFWRNILFNEPLYSGSAFQAHRMLPIGLQHFKQWLFLFNQTVDGLFSGEKADLAKFRAQKIAEVFYYKIEFENGHVNPTAFE
jgi:hemoglobin